MTADKARPDALSHKSIRQAFKDWHSLEALGSHPLAKLEIVKARYRLGQYQTVVGRGLALREVLQSMLSSLRPGDGPADPQEKEWRSYVVLKEQYVQGRSPEWVAAQLHVSRGTYYSDQQRALEMMADLLYEREQQYNRQEDLVKRASIKRLSGMALSGMALSGMADLQQYNRQEDLVTEDQTASLRRSPYVINDDEDEDETEQQYHCQEDLVRCPYISDSGRAPTGMYTRYHVPFLSPPRPTHQVIGREAVLTELKQQLMSGKDYPLAALNGLPGVGKTTLAIALAHDPEILDHFQDGVLWVGLGHQPDVLAGLGTWATSIGIPAEIIGHRSEIAERAATIHATIGLRRMLLIIDDAWQIGAALAFKVGGPNCAYLLTTRLANVALDFAGDRVTTVREFDLEQGLELLAQFSPQAVAEDSGQAQMLVQSVGGLPLALVLMGRYLRKQSYGAQSRRLREALIQLQTAETRLQLIKPESPLEAQPALPPDTPLSLQATIGLNEAALDPVTCQALLDLSLFPAKPNTFSEEAALAVTAAPTRALDTLVDHGLVECVAPNRYTMHQTVADYASLQGASDEAIERMAAYFAQNVEANATNPDVLNLELNNILAAFEIACQANLKDLALRLSVALYDSLFDLQGLYELGVQVFQKAYDVVIANDDHPWARPRTITGDPVSQALILHKTGDLKHKQGQFDEARSYLEQSIHIARAAGASQIEADALLSLGLVCSYVGEPNQARSSLERALSLWQELGSQANVGYVLNALGFAYEESCDYGQAEVYLEEALQVCRTSGNRRGEGWAHYNLGTVYLPLGDFARAREQWDCCLSIYRELGDRRGEIWLIYNLGRHHLHLGNQQAALASFDQARRDFDELGDRFGLACSIHNLGLVHSELGNDAAALAYFEQALPIFRELGCQTGESQTYHSLGVRLRRLGDYEGAKELFEQALDFRRKTNYRRGESSTLSNLGLTYFYLGELQAAQDHCRQGLSLAQMMGIRPMQSRALTYLGHVLRGVGQLAEAAEFYREAICLRHELGQSHLALDPQAGLAQTLLDQGEPAQAQAVTEVLLNRLDSLELEQSLIGADDPGQILLTCYHVLQANQSSRAPSLLRSAHQLLQSRAAKIGQEDQRRLFLERITAHQKIGQLVETS